MYLKIFVLILVMLPSIVMAQNKTDSDSTVKKLRLSYNVDVQAEPVGGFSAMYQKFASEFVFPSEATRNGVQGTVVIYVIIDSNGNIFESGIKSGMGNACDEAVLKAFRSINITWKPALKDGKNVNVKMTIPFSLKV